LQKEEVKFGKQTVLKNRRSDVLVSMRYYEKALGLKTFGTKGFQVGSFA